MHRVIKKQLGGTRLFSGHDAKQLLMFLSIQTSKNIFIESPCLPNFDNCSQEQRKYGNIVCCPTGFWNLPMALITKVYRYV